MAALVGGFVAVTTMPAAAQYVGWGDPGWDGGGVGVSIGFGAPGVYGPYAPGYPGFASLRGSRAARAESTVGRGGSRGGASMQPSGMSGGASMQGGTTGQSGR
jgi:hypothetical protein